MTHLSCWCSVLLGNNYFLRFLRKALKKLNLSRLELSSCNLYVAGDYTWANNKKTTVLWVMKHKPCYPLFWTGTWAGGDYFVIGLCVEGNLILFKIWVLHKAKEWLPFCSIPMLVCNNCGQLFSVRGSLSPPVVMKWL